MERDRPSDEDLAKGRERYHTLRRRVARKRENGIIDQEYILDRLELAFAEADTETLDGAAAEVAPKLAEQPDDWALWIEGTDEDRLASKIVHALVAHLRVRDPELLKQPPLFDWILDVVLRIRPGQPSKGGRDARAHRFRNMLIAEAVRRICGLSTLKPTSTAKEPRSACHAVADRLGEEYETIATIWKNEKKRQQGRGLAPEALTEVKNPHDSSP